MPHEWSTVERRSNARGQAFSFALLLAFLEWQTGSMWFSLLLLLLFAFVLGVKHPAEMPCGVLLLASYIPAAHLFATTVSSPMPHPLSIPVAVLGLPSAYLGAYSGAAVAHLLRRSFVERDTKQSGAPPASETRTGAEWDTRWQIEQPGGESPRLATKRDTSEQRMSQFNRNPVRATASLCTIALLSLGTSGCMMGGMGAGMNRAGNAAAGEAGAGMNTEMARMRAGI